MKSTFIKSKSILLMLAISLTFVASSCMMTQTTVGTYQETASTEYLYAQGKQIWLIEGLFPIGRTNVNTPADGNCKIVTQFTLGDLLISALTVGLVRTYTIRVYAKRGDNSVSE